jgi:hypothetical protein
MAIAPIKKPDLNKSSSFDDEFNNRRFALLQNTGASRFFDVDPQSMVNTVLSPVSDQQMLEQWTKSLTQVQLNEMKDNFELLPKQQQEYEFVSLPIQTQQVLRSSGYELPSEKKQDNFFKRLFTWDIPLLPEEHFGVLQHALAPARAIGFGLGKIASQTWEQGVMRPSRFAQRAWRTAGYLSREESTFHNVNPSRWNEAWKAAEYEKGSFYKVAIDRSIELVGKERTEELELYIRGGLQEVYNHFESNGEKENLSAERIRQIYTDWASSLSEPDMVEALDTLKSGQLTGMSASIDVWNANPVNPDVTPGTFAGNVVGVTGVLAAEILLDPTTWVGGFAVKGVRAVKAGLRGMDEGVIDLWHRVALTQKAADEGKGAIKKLLPNVGGYSAAKQVKDWLKEGGDRVWNGTTIAVRANARAINRMQERIEDSFKQLDEVDAYKIRRKTEDPSISDAQIQAELIGKDGILEATGGVLKSTLLLRDVPALQPIWKNMELWHTRRRAQMLIYAEDTDTFVRINSKNLKDKDVILELPTGAIRNDLPTFSEYDGFWEYLASEDGFSMLASKVGGTSPEASFLPNIGIVNNGWINSKSWARKVLDFDRLPSELGLDMARLTANYIAKQTSYVLKKISDDVKNDGVLRIGNQPEDVVTLSKEALEVLDEEMLQRILTTENIKPIDGLNINELNKIDKARDFYEQTAYRVILDDSSLDTLLKHYQAGDYKMVGGDLKMSRKIGKRGGAWRAARNYWQKQIHPPGSHNADAGRLFHTLRGVGESLAAGAFYYPARFAEKLTTYVPRNTLLDVTDDATAITEFTALVDMGIMNGMSRTKIDNYMQRFVMGDETTRWTIQSEFFLDFIGRSGALLHGGRDVQDFIKRFIRYGHHRYANFVDDGIGIANLNRQRGIVPGQAHGGHLTTTNIIPNYRELAAVSRYINLYRMLGWGLWLPKIDKFISRAWRPAVLLRLGYVARNGGEELMSWMWREGPKGWINQKTAAASMSQRRTWDQYGRKIWSEVPKEEQIPTIYKPISRLWRSINEVAGVGDYAITAKAVKQSLKDNPQSWRFFTEDEKLKIFENTREAILDTKNTGLSSVSRMAFESAEAMAQKLNMVIHRTSQAIGLPTKQEFFEKYSKVADSDYSDRVEALADMMTQPTMVDAHMKHILGTFDNYINPDKLNVDSVLRQSGFGLTAELSLPMEYGATQLVYLKNLGAGDITVADKSIGVAQRMQIMADDPSHIAGIRQFAHYSSPAMESKYRQLAAELGLTRTGPEPWAKVVWEYFNVSKKNVDISTWKIDFARAFDLPPKQTAQIAEEANNVIDKYVAIDTFLDTQPRENVRALKKFFEEANNNEVAFLLNELDPALISTDFVKVKARAKQAFINDLLTPAGQQRLTSTHRSNVGFDALGEVSSPLPPGSGRLFVPYLSQDGVASLVRNLTSDNPEVFRERFILALNKEFEKIGISIDQSEVVYKMLQPSVSPYNKGITPNVYQDLRSSWAIQDGDFVPLIMSSANPDISSAISRALHESLDDVSTAGSGRIGSLDLNTEELLNTDGKAVLDRKKLNNPSITTKRGNVSETTTFAERASIGDIRLQENFWGIGPDGVSRTALDFGAGGMRNETIIGLNTNLLFPRPDGVKSIQMINNRPLTHKVQVHRHKTDGRVAVLRESDERQAYDWYNDDEWEVIDEQIVGHNDLRNAADELAMLNILEIEDLFTSGVRVQGTPEVYQPWVREMLNASKDEIRPTRLADNASRDMWWDKAPADLLTLVPVTNQGASGKEKISTAWNTLLRNWFDGVVNPMIGAMVREPMFQHYLVIAKKQMQGVRKFYNHSPNAYKGLRKKTGVKIVDGQLEIPDLDEFVKFGYVGRTIDPDDPISLLGFNVQTNNIAGFKNNIKENIENLPAFLQNVVGGYTGKKEIWSDALIEELFDWVRRSGKQFEAHRDMSLKRALTLTSSFIDDHRIRSQFQEMVGTALPFWFAEDQFLRRVGRSLNHNPLMLRNLHLTMNVGVNTGLIQEDKFGNKVLVIPGSETLTTAMFEIAEKFPIVNRVFGGPLGAVARAGLSNGISTSLNIIPGYDLERLGQPGFGPLLSVPINLLSHRDPAIRQTFEKNLVGGRYQAASALAESNSDQAEIFFNSILSSILPAVMVRPLQIAGFNPTGGDARTKATQDVIKYLAMNDQLPSENTMTSIEKEKFLDKVDGMAMQLQLLQGMTWFLGPSTGTLADLTTHEGWEWNEDFTALTDKGVPWEEAYGIWINNIEAQTGEPFNPIEHSPFKTGRSNKIPFAVLEATQDANVWMTDNPDFMRAFPNSSAFFLPRKFDSEDTEYVAEAKTRQINMGLTSSIDTEDFLEKIYSNAAAPSYYKQRQLYIDRKYAFKQAGMDTSDLDMQWNTYWDAFQLTHPVFADRVSTSRDRREDAIHEFRLLVNNAEAIPESIHKADIITSMNLIVSLNDRLRNLDGVSTSTATETRNIVKLQAWTMMEDFVQGKPWLNELYYSIFLPMLGDTWIAKYNNGLIKITAKVA